MYQKVHKLVGAAKYAGAMRIAMIADKMQKYVPKESTTPDMDSYRKFHKILQREVKNTFDDYNFYKETGQMRSPSQPQSLPAPP